ncbi:Protein-methionine sulfoxide oxidase MICAL3-like [Oopsacas minuta]|uniref:Protein-methionine sulfoxide oxidase MICAL3-like n=1 Tax=Oopsacas minuta TaxID=111878 RepID=A0AAV7JXM2_9METZ|nr:Protein-methionine sulfoxide oxidase MICAL3-like [Oopsacas minuta]
MDFGNSGSTASLHSQSSISDDSLLAFIDSPATEQSIDTIQELYSQLRQEYNIPEDSNWTENARLFTERLSDSKIWKGERLLRTLLGRSSLPEHREYFGDTEERICEGKRILVVGAGPVGLRFAIEAAFMGAKVDLIEMRNSFSRNNCLHLWPFLVEDLKGLEAKMFYGKFCSGQLDHICIRAAQVILMKICLILGVNIYHNTKFIRYTEPRSKEDGWGVQCEPRLSDANFRTYDVILTADGKKYTLDFKKKEFRAKLAIGISFNFVNMNTPKENEVSEISGISYTYHQDWFKKLSKEHGIDLENIVYYKDETHYYVMTAKRQSLIKKGVLRKDYSDAIRLTDPHNINQKKLENFAIESAKYATEGKMPHFEFSKTHQGENDVALFDFTSLFASQHASKIIKRKGKSLLLLVAGDTLIEPFWPTGSGLARGFLGAFDAAWMIRGYVKGYDPLMLLEEREAILQLLSQTTPQRLLKNYAKYSIDPHTRYNLSHEVLVAGDIRHLYDTDDPDEIEKWGLNTVKAASPLQRRHSRRAHIRKLTNKKQHRIASPVAGIDNVPAVGLKRTYSEPALNKEMSIGKFSSPAKKFLNSFMQKKTKKDLKAEVINISSIPEELESLKSDSSLFPEVSVSSPDILPITQSSSILEKLDDFASDNSTTDLSPSPSLSRPSRKYTQRDTPETKPDNPIDPSRERSFTIAFDSLMVEPRKENSSCENLSLLRTDSPMVIEKKLSPTSLARSKLSGGFIFSRQVTDTLKQLLEMLVQEVGLEDSRYTLELIIYIFRNCQSHSVDEKYYRIPLISQAFYHRVWQFQTGRQFMMQCQWTIMEDLLVLNLGFDLSKPFQCLERKLDTVCHKLASLSMTGDGRKSKKFNHKDIRFFEKEIYDAIPSLKNIPEDLNASFTETKSDFVKFNSFPPIWTQSPPAVRAKLPSNSVKSNESPNSIFKPLPMQIRPSPLQIVNNGITSPLEQAVHPLSKSPWSPPRLTSSPYRSTDSQCSSSQDFLSLESSSPKNDVFITPNTSLKQPEAYAHTTTTTTTVYTIPNPSSNSVTTSTPLIPKLVSVRETPITSTVDQSLSLPDNSDISVQLTADKVGSVIPSDSFMDISLPDNSKPILDIRGNREAEQQLIQQVTNTKQIWKNADLKQKKQHEQTPNKRTSISSSAAGHVVAVMPSHFVFPKLKQCSNSGSESPSPRVTPNSSPPSWTEVKLRSQSNSPSNSPFCSPTRKPNEQETFDIRDREVEKTLSKKTADTRQMWLQNESIVTKHVRPGSAATSDVTQKQTASKPERPTSASNTRTKWPLRETSKNLEVVKGSDPLDKRDLHDDERMLLEKNITQKVAMKI